MNTTVAARNRLLGVSLKMYLDPASTRRWSRRVAELVGHHPALREHGVRLAVFPSTPVLASVVDIFADTPVYVGAQDLFWEDRGPFTGAVSGADLAQLGCRYVEIGHAERRSQFGDDEYAVRRKLAAAWRNGLTPLLCIGELTEESVESAQAWCTGQLDAALQESSTSSSDAAVPLAVAYEPVWAIGQDKAASPRYISAVADAIQAWLRQRPEYRNTPLIYGGSAGPGMLQRLGGSVDGLFLGRFAHDPEALQTILDEMT